MKVENLVTAKVICNKFSISKRTLCRWKNEGLPSIQLSYNMVRYDLEAVMNWVKAKSEQAGAE
jgi:phage terminase Nu1 subunit (DNA packaging protein)